MATINISPANEIWKPVPGWGGLYEASSLGRIRSLPRTITRKDGKPLRIPGQIMLTRPNNRGYPRATLSHEGRRQWYTVHTLIAAAFLPKPDGPIGCAVNEYHVNHKDGDKTNNRIENLEYVTALENMRHARRTGLLNVVGIKNGRSKIGPVDVREIRALYDQGTIQAEIALRFGIDQTQVSRIIRRESWSHIR